MKIGGLLEATAATVCSGPALHFIAVGAFLGGTEEPGCHPFHRPGVSQGAGHLKLGISSKFCCEVRTLSERSQIRCIWSTGLSQRPCQHQMRVGVDRRPETADGTPSAATYSNSQATLRWLEYFNALDESLAKKE